MFAIFNYRELPLTTANYRKSSLAFLRSNLVLTNIQLPLTTINLNLLKWNLILITAIYRKSLL